MSLSIFSPMPDEYDRSAIVVKIIFRHQDGTDEAVEAAEGLTVMETALRSGVDGLLGECGGNMTCSTCHVYIESALDTTELPPISEDEDDLLDFAACQRLPTSRLSCQLTVHTGIDGLVMRVPPSQI
jgi:ferredoxin, 2Fe-2S